MATKTLVSNIELSGMPASSIKANATNSFGQPTDLVIKPNEIVANFAGTLSGIFINDNQVICNPGGTVGLTALNVNKNQVFCNTGNVGLTGLNIGSNQVFCNTSGNLAGLTIPANTVLGNAANGLNAITIQGINGIETSTSGNTIRIDGNNLSNIIANLSAILDPCPIGTVMHFADSSAPVGWFALSGQSLNKTIYPDLFNVVRYTYGGSGDTFCLPDLRGQFLRGWDIGRGVDNARAFGSTQSESPGQHKHDFRDVWTIQGDAANNGTTYYNTPNNGYGQQTYGGYTYAGDYPVNANLNGTIPNYKTNGTGVGVLDVNGEQYLWNVDAENPLARPPNLDIVGDAGVEDGMIWTINNRTATGTNANGDLHPTNVALLPCIKYAQTQALTQVGIDAQNVLNAVNSALNSLNTSVDNVNTLASGLFTLERGHVKKFARQSSLHLGSILVITTDNRVLAWGWQGNRTVDYANNNISPNQAGTIRFIDDNNEDYLTTHPSVTIVDVTYSSHQAMALLSDGTVWLNGYNHNGCFGIADTVPDYTCGFRKVVFRDNAFITSICLNGSGSDGYESFAAISNTNNLYLWGQNTQGHLNTGNTVDVLTPTRVSTPGIINNASKVFISGSDGTATVVVTKDGKVYVCGYNGYGQLGTGNKTAPYTFVQAKQDNTTYITGVKSIVEGAWGNFNNVFLLKTDGTVWGCGTNNYGQLGQGGTNTTDQLYFTQVTNLTNITKVLASGLYGYGVSMIALDSSGNVYTWGYNANGELGTGNQATVYTPTLVASGATDIFAHNGFNTGKATGFIKNNKFYAAGYRVFTDPRTDGNVQPNFYPMHVKNVVDALFVPGGVGDYGDNESVMVITNTGCVYGQGVCQWYTLGAINQNIYTPTRLL